MKISFQPLAVTDFQNLLAAVKRWWNIDVNDTSELIQEKYGTYVDGYKKTGNESKPIHAFIVYLDDSPTVCYIQSLQILMIFCSAPKI